MTQNQNRIGGRKANGESALGSPELTGIFQKARRVILQVFLFSALINLLTLTSAIYMLEVYDRVLPSRSIPTLLVLSAFALMLIMIQGMLEIIRTRILIRIGNHFETSLAPRAFDLVMRTSLQPNRTPNAAMQPVRDIEAVKTFLSGGGPGAMMDLPWLPFYIALVFMFHWTLGVAALLGSAILVGLTAMMEINSRTPALKASQELNAKAALGLVAYKNAETATSMGFRDRLLKRFTDANSGVEEWHTRVSDLTGTYGAVSRTMRVLLQSAMLGIGAALVVYGEASAGIMIAGSILVGRALAPIDMAIANWKNLMNARQAWGRLTQLLQMMPETAIPLALPKPHESLKVESVSVIDPTGQRFLVRGIGFELRAGQGLCIIGASGAGKSTLLRTIANVLPLSGGKIMLDGAPLEQWRPEDLGRELGYVAQDIELIPGTIAENISRLDADEDDEEVIRASKAAGVHQMILNFKDGYQTRVGEGGQPVSAGQRQRIALARALYRDPFLVVLDEPNSNLDNDGDAALREAIVGVRKRGGIVIAASHRPGLMNVFDFVLVMKDGLAVAFGPRDEVVSKFVIEPGAVRPIPHERADVQQLSQR